VKSASRRGHVHLVRNTRGPGFVVKQPLNGSSHRLRREAAFFHLLPDHPPFTKQRSIYYDPASRLLVLSLLPGENLFERHRREWSASEQLAAICGRKVAQLHETDHGMMIGPSSRSLCRGLPPWILTITSDDFRPNSVPSGKCVGAFLGLVRSEPRFREHLGSIAQGWNPLCLIHGDLKWANLIATNDSDSLDVNLIDWEDFEIGDPAWDVGSVFQAYLAFWIWTLPVTPTESLEHAVESTSWPLEAAQRAMREFWFRYCVERKIAGAARQALFERAIPATGARLLQTAFEHAAEAESLTRQLLMVVQMSLNILSRPDAAVGLLLGEAA